MSYCDDAIGFKGGCGHPSWETTMLMSSAQEVKHVKVVLFLAKSGIRKEKPAYLQVHLSPSCSLVTPIKTQTLQGLESVSQLEDLYLSSRGCHVQRIVP